MQNKALIRLGSVFTQNSPGTFIQLVRYTFVGGAAFVIDFSFLYVFTSRLGINYLVSASLSFFIGLVANYLISVFWVFPKKEAFLKNKWLEFTACASIGLIGLGLNALFMWIFTSVFHTHYLLSKIISAIWVYLWNFFARKYLLYSKK